MDVARQEWAAAASGGRGAGHEVSAPPSIETRDLSVSYRGNVVLRDVNLRFRAGRITALVGPSGCGKTTLLTCLNRLSDLTPGCVVNGEVRIGESVISRGSCDVAALRRRVGMIFQRPTPLPMSIRENVHFPLRMHTRLQNREREELVRGALVDVGLWDEVKDRMEQSALTLSGGQQQRLCIARALVLKPQVLLFDEPCSALDPISMGRCEALIRSLGGEFTIVIVTHNLAQARRVADDAAVLWCCDGAGALIEAGTMEQIFEQPRSDITCSYVTGRCG